MTLRFIVAIDQYDKDQERKFKDFVESYKGNWWHWIGNLWLLTFPSKSNMNSDAIWAKVVEIDPSVRVLISVIKETDWLVTDVANSKGQRMTTWLEKNWGDS